MRVLSLLLLAQSASVFEMASPSYPRIGAAGRSIGQSEALAASWPIVAGGLPHLDADLDGIQAFRDNCPFDDGVVDDLDVIATATHSLTQSLRLCHSQAPRSAAPSRLRPAPPRAPLRRAGVE